MTRLILAAGVAALAITAPATAGPDKNRGAKSAHVQKERGAKSGKHFAQQDKARGKRAEKAQKVRKQSAERRQKADGQRAKEQRKVAERRFKAQDKTRERRDDRLERIADRRDVVRVREIDRRDRDGRRFAADAKGYGIGGCPPGLAKKPVRCMPPGQAKNLVGERVRVLGDRVSLRDIPNRLRSVYRDTPDYYYRYGDGYMYRVNRSNDVVSSLLPLFGLGMTAGQVFPTSYNSYGLPMAYQPFYPAMANNNYRYANGYIYEVNPYTGLIEDVDPMLGYGYGYGQMLPATYSAYNVPYQYRPLYYDTPNAYYRYAPGAIYQVDPSTSLITAIASLLSPGLTVGQPLPAGYGAYNVPYAYRTQYYDTPDAMYRYANGSIYRVDPATQLVTALVVSALT
ncbi:MAG TPA: hypothetical protein VHN55_01535 [Sphingomicrobium sp.]|nr:hypothetical protein [Sphingomicrobium sp.]